MDQSKFNIFCSDDQTYIWRRTIVEYYKEKNLKLTFKHSDKSVMILVSMSAARPSNLTIIDGIINYIYNLNKYLQIMQLCLEIGIDNCFSFYQDNDQKHKILNVKQWLLYNYLNVIEHQKYQL